MTDTRRNVVNKQVRKLQRKLYDLNHELKQG